MRKDFPLKSTGFFPTLHDRFWVNLIGKGYPSPNTRFRWCTERLKITPTSRFVREKVSQFGSVVIALGSRILESSTRAQVMKEYRIEGQRFRPHTELTKAWVYMPIQNLSTEQVWDYLLTVDNPWGGDNEGKGPFTHEVRQDLLKRLLQLQKDFKVHILAGIKQ